MKLTLLAGNIIGCRMFPKEEGVLLHIIDLNLGSNTKEMRPFSWDENLWLTGGP